MPRTGEDWGAIAELIEQVVATPGLMDELVKDVQASNGEIAGLEPSDVARHTRALLAAATRAVAARRGPTEAELSFVEELAVTRARQGVPIHAVLAAIHVAERHIWARAKLVAGRTGVDPALVLDARELYDDWAQQVRDRLLQAHQNAEQSGPVGDRDAELLRRLLQGGSTAGLAAAAAGLSADRLWVLVAAGTEAPDLREAVRHGRLGLVAVVGGDTVAVVRRVPDAPAASSPVVAVAGPASAEDLGVLRRRAAAAARAAAARGLTGLLEVAELATLTALQDRADLAGLLLDRHAAAIAGLGRAAAATVATTRAWLESGCDAEATATREFVHANTVRNRVAALTSLTGIDPRDPFQAVDLWWLCTTWQARRS